MIFKYGGASTLMLVATKKAKKLGKICYLMIQQLLRVASTLMLKKAKNLGKIEGSHDIQKYGGASTLMLVARE